VTFTRRRPFATLVVVALGSAIGISVGEFFRSNQNTYLLHAVGPSHESLRSDWLLGTDDAFPVFTGIVRPFYVVAGETGLAVLTVVLSFIGFLSIGVIAYVLCGRVAPDRRTTVAALATLTVAFATYIGSFLRLPFDQTVSPFIGFGLQYMLRDLGMLQPSKSGVFLLAAVAVGLVWGCRLVRSNWLLVLSAGLSAVACSLHPSYLVPLGVALGSMAVADLFQGHGLRRVPLYAGVGLSALGSVLVTNPVARDALHGSDPAVQEYLSFDRVPHHTLLSQWPLVLTALIVVTIVVGALLSIRQLGSSWLAQAMLSALVVSVLAAAVVELTREATLASVFPWRVTVVLTPLAVTAIVVAAISLVAERLSIRTLEVATLVLVLLAGTYGTVRSLRGSSDVDTELVTSIREAELEGVGLIPLDFEDVRLNARVPVFVDWKSHPYGNDDLAEWIRRVEAVEQTDTDPTSRCALIDDEGIGWVLIPSDDVPTCVAQWEVVVDDGTGLQVRRR
jgi:hypothetical protein